MSQAKAAVEHCVEQLDGVLGRLWGSLREDEQCALRSAIGLRAIPAEEPSPVLELGWLRRDENRSWQWFSQALNRWLAQHSPEAQ